MERDCSFVSGIFVSSIPSQREIKIKPKWSGVGVVFFRTNYKILNPTISMSLFIPKAYLRILSHRICLNSICATANHLAFVSGIRTSDILNSSARAVASMRQDELVASSLFWGNVNWENNSLKKVGLVEIKPAHIRRKNLGEKHFNEVISFFKWVKVSKVNTSMANARLNGLALAFIHKPTELIALLF